MSGVNGEPGQLTPQLESGQNIPLSLQNTGVSCSTRVARADGTIRPARHHRHCRDGPAPLP
eukprot:1491370-Prymnesium_polylepis.1